MVFLLKYFVKKKWCLAMVLLFEHFASKNFSFTLGFIIEIFR